VVIEPRQPKKRPLNKGILGGGGGGGIRTLEPPVTVNASRLLSFGSTMRADARCATHRATVVRYTPSALSDL
jgi:hypothetical protein